MHGTLVRCGHGLSDAVHEYTLWQVARLFGPLAKQDGWLDLVSFGMPRVTDLTKVP